MQIYISPQLLIEFCKSNDLFVLNGRIGEKCIAPKPTCKDRSTVDYFLSSAYVMEHICKFRTIEFSPLFSDAHCAVMISLGAEYQSSNCKSNESLVERDPVIKYWDQEKSNIFVNNIDLEELSRINRALDSCSEKQNIGKADIDYVVYNIEHLFKNACKSSFGFKRNSAQVSHTSRETKPWFTHECRNARNMYHKIRRLYNKYKTEHYKKSLKGIQ